MASLKPADLAKIKQFRRFISVGAMAFVAEYSFFALLHWMGWKAFAAQALSFLVGFAISFYFNRNWAFKNRQGYLYGPGRQLSQYLSLAAINLIITSFLIGVLVAVFPALVAKIMVMALVVGWNFVLYRTVIFRPSTQRVNTEPPSVN